MKWLRVSVVAVSVGLGVVVIGTGPAGANTIVDFGDLGFGWRAVGDIPDGDTLSLSLNLPRGQLGGPGGDAILLTKTATFRSLDPIVITFSQTGRPNPGGAGQYFNLTENATNNTPQAWAGFLFTIEDRNGRNDVGQRLHPFQAHFHTPPLMTISPFTQVTSATATAGHPAWGVSDMTASGGIVPNNAGFASQWTASTVRMHDRPSTFMVGQTQLLDTQFVFTERPIPGPEPGTLTLSGIGGLGLLGYGWLRRKRAGMPASPGGASS